MTKELKQFIKDNIKLIELDQYYELYCKLNNTFKYEATSRTKELTEFLIDCNVNPLEYMPTLPQGYLCRSDLLDHIVIPENIDLVGRAAFMDSGLKSVSFSDRSKCTHIIAYAFQSCQKLETVILPAFCTHIGTSAFRDCYYLQDVVIPTKDKIAFSDDAFEYSDMVVIHCYPGTPVEEYCITHDINYKLIEPEKRKW